VYISSLLLSCSGGECVLSFYTIGYQYNLHLRSNLLATRGRKLSIFQHTPQRNLYIFGAMPIALLIAIFFSYIPWLYVPFMTGLSLYHCTDCMLFVSQQVFKTSGIPVEHFLIPIAFAFGLLLYVFSFRYVFP
jgi:sodium/potassium-transporting ATPase subunit alpha